MVYFKNLFKISDTKYGGDKWFSDTVSGINGKTIEQLRGEGILIENVPKMPIAEVGKYAELYYNPIANTCFWDFVNIPQVQTTENRLSMLESAVNDLILGGI